MALPFAAALAAVPWGTVLPIAATLGTWAYDTFFKKPSKSKTKVEPPSFTAPLLKQASSEAQRLYGQREGYTPYPYERVAPLSAQTRSSIAGLGNVAQDINNPYLTGLMNAPLQSVSNLSEMASGKLIGGNPYVNTVLQNALGSLATNINEQMSSYGRYGSGAHTGALAQGLGNVATSALMNQYNTDVTRMLQANQLMQQGQLGQMQAAGQLSNARSAAYLNALQGAGVLDKYQQDIINANMQKWNEEQQQNWSRLGAYSTLGKQLSEGYSTTTNIGAQPDALQNLAGAISTGASAANVMQGAINPATQKFEWGRLLPSVYQTQLEQTRAKMGK